eukprot:gene1790-1995_t
MSSQDQTIEIDLEMPENYFSQCVQMEDLDAEDTVAAEINRTEVANERRNILPQKDKESLSTNINDTETGNIFSVGKRLESLNEVEEAKTSYEKATFCCPFEIYLALSADGKALKRNETANVDVIVDEKNNFKCLFYQEETDSTIQSAVDCFKNSNTHWDNTKVIRTDKDFNERDVLERSFPQASMQICLYHALRSFRREITMEKMGITSDERASDDLKKYADCVTSFVFKIIEKQAELLAKKYKKALKIAQAFASVAVEGGIKIFTTRMEQMQSLLNSWQAGDSSNSTVKSKKLSARIDKLVNSEAMHQKANLEIGAQAVRKEVAEREDKIHNND